MYDIPCIIFAGGKSSRMGEDKSLLPFAGYNSLTHYQYQRLKKLFKRVYISSKSKEKFDFEAEFIEDIPTENIFAPTVGFVSVFRALRCDSFFVLSVDTPFITQKEIAKLINADSREFDATIAKSGFGLHPLCGLYHRSLQKEFEKMLHKENHKLGFLLKSSKTNYILFNEEKPFTNLNYFDEYKEALESLDELHPPRV